MNRRDYLKTVAVILVSGLFVLVTYLIYLSTKAGKDKLVGVSRKEFFPQTPRLPQATRVSQVPQNTRKMVHFSDDVIRSSDGYGFKDAPPLNPIIEENSLFLSLPTTTTQKNEKFGIAKSKTCVGSRSDFYMGSVLPECQTYCDNACTAFVYNETNGDCSIFKSCTDLKDAAESLTAFVRVAS